MYIINRIIEIEWAVNNGKPWQASPKQPRKSKSRKTKAKHKGASTSSGSVQNDRDSASGEAAAHSGALNADQYDENVHGKGKGKENMEHFGAELTNKAANYYIGSPPKRLAGEMLSEGFDTPGKHKKGKMDVADDDGDDGDWEQWEPPAPAKTKNAKMVL